MKQYAIKKKNEDRIVSTLTYDENTKTYTIDIPMDISEREMPFYMSLFAKKGKYHLEPEESLRWVRSRIIPNSRQNIGQILRENGWKSYDEQLLLTKNKGMSCQDEFYLEEMEE